MRKNLKSKWSTKNPFYVKTNGKNYDKYVKQLRAKGFSDTETWGLNAVIAEFILPRLIRFKELNNGFPGGIDGMTMETWKSILDKMIFAFEWSLNNEDKKYDNLTEAERLANWGKYQEGMDLFSKWFNNLWW
jgi:hypothetical protein